MKNILILFTILATFGCSKLTDPSFYNGEELHEDIASMWRSTHHIANYTECNMTSIEIEGNATIITLECPKNWINQK